MKTATVTWITYNNYGTVLQAYALQKYIESLGYENEIISDELILNEHKNATTHKKPTARTSLTQASSGPIDRLRRLLSNPHRIGRILEAHVNRKAYQFPYYGSQGQFAVFKNNELRIRHGVSSRELMSLNGDYDTFICGSDQIWSVFDRIFDPYYYLSFAGKKKIAYAPSLGTDRIPEGTTDKIRELLVDFSAISVRERVSAEQLKGITGRDVEWVCDPTLLHDRSFWNDFVTDVRRPAGKYLLCYFLENKPWYFERAKEIAGRLHLKIKLVPNKWEYLSNENVLRYAVGPREFAALFQSAAFVLTDSYHGSIFSMIFERSFLYLQRFSDDDANSQNIRIQSLFSYLGINDRIITGDTPASDAIDFPDYERITKRLREYRSRSQAFLIRSMT